MSIAKAFHQRFKKDSGMSPTSVFEGFVVKGSNGPGGASALLAVQGTTQSRSKKFNKWMNMICPDKEDEVIMVGQFSPLYLIASELKKHTKAITLLLILVTALYQLCA